ncbi:hypothetical protein F5B22DRAFT_304368 [Xylaria bambusicola]|uniref:uncharacterized protein n=1 Tax=Xylaria bambusicola TaxID=326684 RepID=UPI0020073E38|nr:uncharacterized protein F5B22DRAFT_304368 [Xylaria bambusicola]KAI0512476.1 hypothetical protein F5B22DRAFT_304368 [Xylaria bambusicola]
MSSGLELTDLTDPTDLSNLLLGEGKTDDMAMTTMKSPTSQQSPEKRKHEHSPEDTAAKKYRFDLPTPESQGEGDNENAEAEEKATNDVSLREAQVNDKSKMSLNQDGKDEGLLMTVMTFAEWEDGRDRLRQIAKDGLEAFDNIAIREEMWGKNASKKVPTWWLKDCGGQEMSGALLAHPSSVEDATHRRPSLEPSASGYNIVMPPEGLSTQTSERQNPILFRRNICLVEDAYKALFPNTNTNTNHSDTQSSENQNLVAAQPNTSTLEDLASPVAGSTDSDGYDLEDVPDLLHDSFISLEEVSRLLVESTFSWKMASKALDAGAALPGTLKVALTSIKHTHVILRRAHMELYNVSDHLQLVCNIQTDNLVVTHSVITQSGLNPRIPQL